MGTTAKLAGRAMQTTHACNWATMKRKKKRKKKKPPKASEGKERQRSPGFTRKAQGVGRLEQVRVLCLRSHSFEFSLVSLG